jgi:PAS domain S-box-containing protein
VRDGEGNSRTIDQAIREISRFLEENKDKSDAYPEVRQVLRDLLERRSSPGDVRVPGLKETGRSKGEWNAAGEPHTIPKGPGRDIRELKKAQETLLNRIRNEELISTIARQFISAPTGQIFEEIRIILGRIGERIGAERCLIGLFSDDGTTIEEIYEWCTRRTETIEPYVTGTSVEGYRWMMPRLTAGETVMVANIGSLLPEAQAEQSFWKNIGAKSVLYLPLMLNGELIGIFAVMHRRAKKWSGEDQRLLGTIGNLFVQVIARKRNEDALIESEQKFRTIFDSHLNPIIIAGDHGVLTDANIAALEFMERRMEDMQDRPVTEWMPGFEQIRPSMTPPQARRRTIETEYTVHGRTKSMLLQVVPLTIGRRTLLYGIGQDITQRKRAEQEIREQKKFLEAILREAGDGIIVYDASGNHLVVNDAAREIIGYRGEAILQETRRSPGIAIPGEDALQQEDSVVKRALSGERVIGTEVRYTGLDGKARDVLLSATPVTQGNVVIGAVTIFKDITDLVEARKQSQLLALLVESSEDAIIGRDREGNIIAWNPGAERIYGWTREEVLGKQLTGNVPPDRVHEQEDIPRRILTGEHIDHFETRRMRKDGRVMDISASISPIYGVTGEIIGRSTIARDITEMKRLSRELEMSEKQFRHIASFTQENPQPILEIRNDGSVAFANIACDLALRRLGLPNNPDLFFPKDMEGILTELRNGNDGFFYREILIGNAIFGESIYLSPEHDTIRMYVQDLTRERQQK